MSMRKERAPMSKGWKFFDCFDVKHVTYKESKFKDTRVSECKIITSEQESIVSFEHFSIYCVNHDVDIMDFVLKKDRYSYYMMNVIDYLIGNIDRHWGNWGFTVNNQNNKIGKIHSLMDFNKAFLSYETTDGAMCQTTTEKRISQKQAAIEAVKEVGLNQLKNVDRDWCNDESKVNMFFERLTILQNAVNEAGR